MRWGEGEAVLMLRGGWLSGRLFVRAESAEGAEQGVMKGSAFGAVMVSPISAALRE